MDVGFVSSSTYLTVTMGSVTVTIDLDSLQLGGGAA